MSSPLVHVLVINWNGLEHLQECFESLLASTYENVRFVLVDNASTDGSVAFVREHYGQDQRVEFLTLNKNLGWSGGNNEGMLRALDAHADYIFLLNNDTWTAPDAVERLVEMAEARPEIGALAPKMLMFDEPQILNSVGLECSIIGSCWDRGLGRLDRAKWDTPAQVIGVCGGAFFIRASLLERTGLLPDFEIYLDDLDLCLALWNAGSEIWTCPAARVRHKFSATMGFGERFRRKYYLNTRNRLRVLLRDFPVSAAWEIAQALVVGEGRAVGRGMLDGEWWRVAAHVRAWVAAAGYVPEAWTERERRKREHMAECRFWHLVRREPLFFGGTEFPENGWYAPQEICGEAVRPMAGRAWVDVKSSRLRLVHVNAYPRIGATRVLVISNGQPIAELGTLDRDETALDVLPGRVEFEARTIFDADETGAGVDIGGWLRVSELNGDSPAAGM